MEKTVEIRNKSGLHARPASLLVEMVKDLNADIYIEKEDKRINAKSLFGIISLGVSQGNTIKIIVKGGDEQKIINKIVDFIYNYKE